MLCCCWVCIWLLLCKEGQPVVVVVAVREVIAFVASLYSVFNIFGIRCSVFGVRYSVFSVRFSFFAVRCSVSMSMSKAFVWSHVESSSTQWNLKFAASVWVVVVAATAIVIVIVVVDYLLLISCTRRDMLATWHSAQRPQWLVLLFNSFRSQRLRLLFNIHTAWQIVHCIWLH